MLFIGAAMAFATEEPKSFPLFRALPRASAVSALPGRYQPTASDDVLGMERGWGCTGPTKCGGHRGREEKRKENQRQWEDGRGGRYGRVDG